MNLKRRAPLYWAVAAALITESLTGCGSSSPAVDPQDDDYVYCIDQRTGEVDDPDDCTDANDSTHILWIGHGGSHSSYPKGYVVPYSNGRSIRVSDQAARTNAGLPATGVVKGSSGGFGTGIRAASGAGSGAKGGFGGFGGGNAGNAGGGHAGGGS